MRRILLLNPFRYRSRGPNVLIDPVLRRHTGQEVKTGLSYPVGLGYLAAVAINAGCSVEVLDPVAQRVSIKTIHEQARRADVIVAAYGFSHAEDLSRLFAEHGDKLRIACGPVAEMIHERLLEGGNVDLVLMGEPEETFAQLIAEYPDLADIPGLAYRDSDGGIRRTAERPLNEALNSLPFPFRRFGNPRGYWDISFFGQPTAWVLPSRGCPYGCIFCSSQSGYGRRVRRRSAANIVDEVEQVVREHRIRCFAFMDDTFNLDSAFVQDFCRELIRRKLDIAWETSARADCARPEDLALMKQSGCIEVQYGLESANDEILKYLGKATTVEKIRHGLDLTRQAGINFSLYCILGSPMETPQTIARTMDFIRQVRPLLVSFNVLTPLPGSRLYDQMQEELAAHGDLSSFDILHTDLSLCQFSAAQLQKIIRRAYREFYLSPRFAARLLHECLKRPALLRWMLLKGVPRQAWYVFRSILWGGR